MAVTAVVGLATYRYDGLEFRSNAHFLGLSGDIGHLGFHRYIADRFYLCTPRSVAAEAEKWEGFIRCNQSKPGKDIDVALLGDSHAEHLFIGIAEALPARNVVFYTRGNPPFVDTLDFEHIWDTVLRNQSIKTVVYTMNWGWRGSQLPDGVTFEGELRKSIDALTRAGKHVILTEDVPSFPFPPERCLVRPLFAFVARNCAIPAEIARMQTEVYRKTIEAVVNRQTGARFLPTHQYFCDSNACSMTKDGAILYRDDNHLNITGSEYLGRRLIEDHGGLFGVGYAD
jgi:hypothetical protein